MQYDIDHVAEDYEDVIRSTRTLVFFDLSNLDKAGLMRCCEDLSPSFRVILVSESLILEELKAIVAELSISEQKRRWIYIVSRFEMDYDEFVEYYERFAYMLGVECHTGLESNRDLSEVKVIPVRNFFRLV